jgi:hypothetical protein
VPGAPRIRCAPIVGIVGDVKHYGLQMPITNQAYLPHAQPPWPMPFVTMVVRIRPDRDPMAIAAAVRDASGTSTRSSR